MILTTERLILRPWCARDAESLYTFAKDPQVGPAAGWQPHKSIAESLSVIENILNGPECYAVCRKEDNIAIGSAELILNEEDKNECELGYWLAKPFWGRGYIPEASEALLSRAFLQLSMAQVRCAYFEGNEKSRRVQEKLGFAPHSIDPARVVPPLNETKAMHINLLTREAWAKSRGIE